MNLPYKAILVYDISRWGRFQRHPNEAGPLRICVQVGRCPGSLLCQTFPNDGTLPATTKA